VLVGQSLPQGAIDQRLVADPFRLGKFAEGLGTAYPDAISGFLMMYQIWYTPGSSVTQSRSIKERLNRVVTRVYQKDTKDAAP
jgi:hypothetical protein